MKHLKYILLLMTVFSCRDFLEEDLKSQVSTDDFYSNINDAERALNGAYSYLSSLYTGTGLASISDITSDVLADGAGGGGSSITPFDDFGFNASSGDLLFQYENHYLLIGAVNTLLDKIKGKQFNSPKQAIVTGEAKFLRAFAYFNLVRLFGGVPLRTTSATSVKGLNEPRDSEDAVFNQIVEDLTAAVNALNEASLVKGRANKIAAQTLLAKVYLTIGKNDDAIALLEQVIGKRSLYPSYADVFKVANENNTVESIFEVQYGLRPYSNNIIQYYTPVQVSGIGFVYGIFQAEQTLVDAYDENDVRKDVTIWSEIQGKPFGGYYIRKFNDGLTPGVQATDAGQINFPVLRYADVLLMYAEALNAKSNGPTPEAYDAVQQVRTRAGLVDPLPAGLSQQEFIDTIMEERLLEFAAEGHRWFDLKRTNALSETLADKGFVAGKHEVFPIPRAAIDANSSLTQNSQY